MNSFTKKLALTIEHVLKFKKTFVISVFYSCMNSFMGVATSALASYMVALAILRLKDYNTLKSYLLALVVLVLLKALFSYLEMYEVHVFAYQILNSLRKSLYDAIHKASLYQTDKYRTGELSSIIMEDVESAELLFAHILPNYISCIICSVVYLVILYKFSPLLMVTGLIAIPLIVVVPFIFKGLGKKLGIKIRSQMALVASDTIDIIQGMVEILVFNRKDFYVNRLVNSTEKLNKLRLKDEIRKGFNVSSINLISSLLIAAVLIIANKLIINNSLDGIFLPLVLSLSFSILGPAIGVSSTASRFLEVYSSLTRVENILRLESMREDGNLLSNIEPNNVKECGDILKIKNLSFSYDGKKKILDNLNLNIKKGEIIGIRGTTGTGKSTLAKLIMSFYLPQKGEIFIYNESYKNLKDRTIRDNISYIAQDTYLFHGNFKDNIRLAKSDASDEEIEKACELALADEFIKKLPQGYESKVGERGLTLSAGQKQRISIARAILKDSPILLMDEATSNLDSENERLFYQALKNLKDKTIIMIAHRPSSLKYASRIFKLENGKLIEDKIYQ